MTATWRCVLVGGESLLIQCAQILEQQGHQVAAVVTSRTPIRKWAAERGIRVLPNAAALLAAQDLRPFDYLFSVTNLSVLNADVSGAAHARRESTSTTARCPSTPASTRRSGRCWPVSRHTASPGTS